MAESTIWWVLAGSLVILELLTGTFYLLMVAVGVAAAALAAHAGANVTVQLVAASLVGGGAVALWHQRQKRHPKMPPAQSNPDVVMDVGETVHIQAWNADGTAQVHYRGAQWTAVHRPGVNPSPGTHRVAELIGNRLLVDKTSSF